MNVRKFGLAITSVIVAALLMACSPLSQPATPTATAAATATATATPTATTATQVAGSVSVCGTYENHLYEACTAYVWNDAHFSLQPYYKYVHSDSPFSFLKNRLAIKYHDQALQVVQQRVAGWPKGTNTVHGPEITIVTARSSLTCDRAVLTTREDWTVYAPDGTVLYQENQQPHTVVLHRIPDQRFEYDGHVLHQWAVYAIYDGEQNLSVC
jgi:hypothetical protein